ncbi:MAG: PrsW family intramembrane metalloprotease [Halobacteriales archaeon]
MDPRRTLRIARWELLKGTDSVNRRTVLVALAAIAVTASLGVAVSLASVSPDQGIYVVGVDGDSPYERVVERDDTFVVRDAQRDQLGDGIDLYLSGAEIEPADTRKGRAALSSLRDSVRRYNEAVMAGEENESAAFPLSVRLEYVERNGATPAADPTDGDDGGSDDGGGFDGDATGGPVSGDGSRVAVPRVGGQPLFTSTQQGRPGDISPPFPFGALVLAFAFVVPMNFVIQAYGASVLRERIDRRGELLLVSPASPGDIVAGKTLPYLLTAVGAGAAIALYVGGGVGSVGAVVPIALMFLAATFLAAMFARSFKELTFLTVTISVGLTSYLFVPAIFTEVTPIALISPLTLVVRDLLGQGFTAGQYVFSTAPFYAAAAVLFVLGLGTYREEDMFTQRPVHLKALDALATRLRGPKSVAAMTVALIPFVVVAELLAVAILYPLVRSLPAVLVVPLFFAAVALVEELAKSVHVFGGYVHGRFEDSTRGALTVGAASGVGFFLGEKVLLFVYLAGLPALDVGRMAFPETAGLAAGPTLALLVAPLALHVATASISALGARRSARRYGLAFLLAVVVHLVYNLGVVLLVA